jgi:hypothetical protein
MKKRDLSSQRGCILFKLEDMGRNLLVGNEVPKIKKKKENRKKKENQKKKHKGRFSSITIPWFAILDNTNTIASLWDKLNCKSGIPSYKPIALFDHLFPFSPSSTLRPSFLKP